MFTSLAGSSVIVTGASKGIGKGIAAVFASAGAQVMLSSRDASALESAAAEIEAGIEAAATTVAAGKVAWFAADVSDPDACAALADATIERFGGIDVLCANAGIFPERLLAEMTVADLDLVFGVNVKGTILATQACLPALRASGHGRVVVTSSITGPVTGFRGWSHYGASKAAQLGFVRTAAIELAADGITVNAVLPGNIATEGLAELGQDYIAGMEASIPLGRLGTPEDIGHACLFLATREAGYITGQTLIVDGGQVLPESPEAMVG